MLCTALSLSVSVITVDFIMYFFADPERDSEPSKKLELWKTSSLDRNLQLNQAHAVKRYFCVLCPLELLYFSLEIYFFVVYISHSSNTERVKRRPSLSLMFT